MADAKISALPAVVTPTSTDEFAVNQGGTTKKETRAQVHALESGEHLVLPQVNEPATPTLAFGNADTGFYADVDDRLDVAIAGARKWQISDFQLGGVGTGFGMLSSVASATTPSLLPSSVDINTGVGSAVADSMSLIAGGIEGLRLTEASSHVIQHHEAQVGITADVSSVQGGGVLLSTYNVISVSGTAGDAVTLPAVFEVGTKIWIKNDAAANAIDIFPASGDDAGAGADTAISLAAGSSALFIGTVFNDTWTQMV